MKARLMAVALAGILSSGGAQASDLKYDGNELLRQCQQYIKIADSEKNYDVLEAGICAGFIGGVNGTVYFYSDVLKRDEKYCMPSTVQNAQMVRIVVKYLKDNPKLLDQSRVGLVWAAFKDAYPCK